MPTFKATSPSGEIIEYIDTLPDPAHLQSGWRLEQIIIAEASPDAPEPEPVGKVMTKLEYLRRFTQEERILIRTVAASNPVLADYMALLELAQEVDTNDPDTQAAVQMLEAAGLIAAGRGAEILYG
jgi:hypothetical protein